MSFIPEAVIGALHEIEILVDVAFNRGLVIRSGVHSAKWLQDICFPFMQVHVMNQGVLAYLK